MTEDTKTTYMFSGELKDKLEGRINQLGECDYYGKDKGAATVCVVEDEIMRFVGRMVITSILNFFRKEK